MLEKRKGKYPWKRNERSSFTKEDGRRKAVGNLGYGACTLRKTRDYPSRLSIKAFPSKKWQRKRAYSWWNAKTPALNWGRNEERTRRLGKKPWKDSSCSSAKKGQETCSWVTEESWPKRGRDLKAQRCYWKR